MRSFTFLALAAASMFALVGAQTLPACATSCLTTAIASSNSSCGANIGCLCQDQTFLNSALGCLETTCSSSDLATAIQGAEAECAQAGVTVNPSILSAASTALGTASAAGASASASVSGSAASPSVSAGGSSASSPAAASSPSAAASSPSASPSSAAMVGVAPSGLLGALLAVAGIAIAL